MLKAAITWMRYNNGWSSVIRNISGNETHGTYYIDGYDNEWPPRLPCKNWMSSNNVLFSIISKKYDRIICELFKHILCEQLQ